MGCKALGIFAKMTKANFTAAKLASTKSSASTGPISNACAGFPRRSENLLQIFAADGRGLLTTRFHLQNS